MSQRHQWIFELGIFARTKVVSFLNCNTRPSRYSCLPLSWTWPKVYSLPIPPTPPSHHHPPVEKCSHIWAILASAAQQGMLFTSLTLEQGIKIIPNLWKREYFNKVEFFPIIPDYSWSCFGAKLRSQCHPIEFLRNRLCEKDFLVLQLSGVGSQIHLFLCGTDPESQRITEAQLHSKFQGYPPGLPTHVLVRLTEVWIDWCIRIPFRKLDLADDFVSLLERQSRN